MSTFKPIAPIEPDEEFDPDAYERMIAAIERMTGKTHSVELQEAFNPNQARFPKGHPKAGQWRPKLVTGAGRVAPGHLDRDLASLVEHIADMQKTYGGNAPPQRVLNEIGTQVEKTALRYSARKTYEQRLEANRAEAKVLRDQNWDAYEQFFHHPSTTPEMVDRTPVDALLSPADTKRLRELADEEVRLVRERDFADRDAMLGVLQKIRPMGGTLRQAKVSYAVDQASWIERDYIEDRKLYGPRAQMPGLARKAMKDDLDKSLKQVLKVVPKAWLDDTNSKGEVSWLFSKDRAWADTKRIEPKRPKDDFRQMEDGVDQALKGELPQKLVGQAASDVLSAGGDPFPSDADDAAQTAWRARRDEEQARLAAQKYQWVGRQGSPKNPNYPKGLWAVVRGQDDGHRYFVDWGGNLHLIREPREGDSPVDRANYEMPIQEGPREDRRVRNPPLTYRQQQAIELTKLKDGSYEGMYAERYPVVRREGTEEGGTGPNAAIYDWVDDDGTMKNLQVDAVAPDGKFDPAKWDRSAPQPPDAPTSTDTTIKIDPREKGTLLHELSHRLEIVYGETNRAGYNPISDATHAFLSARTAGEEPQRLQDLYPGYAYEDHELARADKFVDAYVGKLYAGQVTEVLTMGMQMLWFPQYGTRDINKDPEMRQLILGLQATL